jgi:hypothetical protein
VHEEKSRVPAGERRTGERYVLVGGIQVQDGDSGRVLGELVDISGHGLLLSAAEPLTLHRRYSLVVPVPEEGEPALVLTAEAAWSVRVLNPAAHRVGFRHLATRPGQEILLDRLIDRCYRPAGG